MTGGNGVPQFYRDHFPDLVGEPSTDRRGRPVVTVPPSSLPALNGESAYGRAALANELDLLAAATEGHRNDQLNLSAFALSQLVAAGHLDRTEVWESLYSTAVSIGLTPTETAATLRSAFGAGVLHPREVPELEETAAPEVTVLATPEPDAGQNVGQDTAPAVVTDEEEPPTLRDLFPALDWHALWADDTEDEWIVYPLIPARRLVALYSPPKVGKSLLMLEIAVAVSRGTAVLGGVPAEPIDVLYVDFENDPRGDVRTRLKAMGYGPGDLDRLHYLSYPRLAYLDTHAGGAELLAVATEYGARLVCIDTISRAVSGEENENDTWLAFYRNTGQRLKAAGIAAIRLDHTGKDATKGMRGGSAKYGDVDAVWSMTKVSEDVFVLECTANRLPIGEKELVVRRSLDPLRHTVDVHGKAAAFGDHVAKARALLDALDPPLVRKDPHARFPPPGMGHDPVWARVREAARAAGLGRVHVRRALDEFHGIRNADDPEQDRLDTDWNDRREDA